MIGDVKSGDDQSTRDAFFWPWLRSRQRTFRPRSVAIVGGIHLIVSIGTALGLRAPEYAGVFANIRVVLYGLQATLLLGMLAGLAFWINPPHWAKPEHETSSTQAQVFHQRWLWLWATWILLYSTLFAIEWSQREYNVAVQTTGGQLRRVYRQADSLLGASLDARDNERFVLLGPKQLRIEPAPADTALKSRSLGSVNLEDLSLRYEPHFRDSVERMRSSLDVAGRTAIYLPLNGLVPGLPESTVRAADSLSLRLAHAGRRDEAMRRWASVLLNAINNLQTLMLVLCYFWLAQATGSHKRDIAQEPFTYGMVIVLLLTIGEGCVVAQGESGAAAAHLLGWLSGFLSGLGLAFVAERLSSTMTGTPRWAVALLLAYAIIQSGWGGFSDSPPLMLALTSIALVFKLLLFAVGAWMMDTGSLLFYFEKRYALMDESGGSKAVDRERAEFIRAYLNR